MRVIKHVLQHKAALLLVVCLLVVQAFTDLALPTYTSSIVDVGIQQAGVEHVATEKLSAETFEAACAMSSEDDQVLLRDSYTLEGDVYVLNEYGEKHREQLDEALTLPFVALSAQTSAVAAAKSGDGALEPLAQNASSDTAQSLDLPNGTQSTGEEGSLPLSAVASEIAGADEALLEQQAIQAARAEYERLGYDMQDMQMGYLVRTGAKMLGMAALGMLASICVGFVAARTGARIGYDLRSRLFARVVAFSDADVGKFSVASLITRGTNDIQLIQMVSIMLMRMVLYAPILALGGIIMITTTNASMGWIIVVAIVAVFAVLGVVFGVALPKFKIMQKLIDRVNLVAREMLSGMPVIRAFGREQVEEARFDEASANLMKTQLFTNRVMAFMMPCMMLIMNAVSVAIVWFGGHYVDAGTIQTGDLIAFITYAMVIISGFLMIGMIAIMLPRADVAAERIDEVLSMEPSVCDPQVSRWGAAGGQPGDGQGGGSREGLGARIEFNDVSFRYDEAGECVLEHVSFVAEPGQTLAVVGSTGSGKSTIVKLIERFYDVSFGSITIDGVDIRHMTQAELRSQLGCVPQKAFLFTGDIESNVAYGLPEKVASRNESSSGFAGGIEDAGSFASVRGAATESGCGKGIAGGACENERVHAVVSRALDIAQASDFVAEREDGVHSEVSQGGTNVSGGQRQRLAIARALATNARAYLFDDSFSALDYKTDALLRQRLAQDLGAATQIIVAQRISTVMHADCIVVLDEGRVVGKGTHQGLMESCEEYREIAYSQLSDSELKGGDLR